MVSTKKGAKKADPIFDSIEERKEYGSYLSVIKGKDKEKVKNVSAPIEEFEFGLTGKGIP